MLENFSLNLLPILLLATPSLILPLHTHIALRGRPSYLSLLNLCLGLQTPLNPRTWNDGEYPACAAMTTGYIFRVENQATVMFLQRIGRTAHLLTLEVSPPKSPSPASISISTAALPTIILLSQIAFSFSSTSTSLNLTLALLLTSRLLITITLRSRTLPTWHGAPEPNVKGDLLILVSEDRWVRLKGLVDDLKAVTSGSWLSSPPHPKLMDALDWISQMLVYLAVVVLANASDSEKVMLVGTVTASHLLLMYENSRAETLVMHGRTVKLSEEKGSVKKYGRRLEMADELVKEMGRSDFAVRLGMINPEQAKKSNDDASSEVVTM
ncbi:hypothetical protein H2200_008161 [Cladophialophora chaetospira]|uniref:Uncharacterized protein n=1 Tax=Cladophialophora chaetospira TaxID=386627 RepID=A0AA39CFV6_9EURO|nr:hypothetical protein H2200_008161 [Cladophialophora chaetospira]